MRRNQMLRLLACLPLLIAVTSWTAGEAAEVDRREEWLFKMMSGTKDVAGALQVQRFKDPWYILLKPISWSPSPNQGSHRSVKVPRGFVSDFASIPREFWSLLRPDGEYAYAAVIHDWLYWVQVTSREEADAIFDNAMRDFHVDALSRVTITAAVRQFGESYWKENKRLKNLGEKRVLVDLPEDPTITWAKWKSRANVFGPD